MGQKINPIGLRVAVDKDWRSRWFATKRTYGTLLSEDLKIRDVVKQRLEGASLARVDIERYANRVRVSLHTARPGAVLGRKGQELEKMRQQIAKFTGKEIYIEIQEIRDPDCNAQLVAENIALQMERRVSFRRAMKRAIKMAMDLGAEGIKIRTAGRLGGSELARVTWDKEGRIPLHTLRANIEYGFAEAATTAGRIGVKVWICKKPEDKSVKVKR
ncbi:MAG: 30S ribosomal protein S3 [Kiritimatiellia bacterium]